MKCEFLNRVVHILKREIGLNPESIGIMPIKRAVAKRKECLGIEDNLTYLELLESSLSERQALVEDVVVSESWFYRDRDGFEALKNFILSIKEKDPRRTVRILSLPCAHGEEPLSIAIFLNELGLSNENYCIVGVDVSVEALRRAKSGLYHLYAFRGCSESYVQQNFIKISNSLYQISPSIQSQVEFVQMNASDESILSLGTFDVIFCRNLLIYMDMQDQADLLLKLTKILSRDGMLVLTAAESIAALNPSLNLVSVYNSCCFKFSNSSTDKSKSSTQQQIQTKTIKQNVRPREKSIRQIQKVTSTPIVTSNKFTEVEELANKGEYVKAQNLCEQSLCNDSSNAELHYLLGVIRGALGNSKAASESYRKALYLNPSHSEAALALSLLVYEKEESARLRQRSIKFQSKSKRVR